MRFQQMPVRIVKRLSHQIHKLLGIDSISGAKIRSRKDLKKIGSKYGGWVVASTLLNPHSICYCVGCGEDISFDLDIIDLFGCSVYGFDPTPAAITYVTNTAGENPKYHFYDIGLWDKEDTLKFFPPKNPNHCSHSLVNLQATDEHIYVNVNRLSRIMKDLGHRKLDLLKIDIEGAEYNVIRSIIEDDIDIRMICVEYDECFNFLDANFKDRIRDSVNSLIENGYSLVCAQGNGNYTFVKNA